MLQRGLIVAVTIIVVEAKSQLCCRESVVESDGPVDRSPGFLEGDSVGSSTTQLLG